MDAASSYTAAASHPSIIFLTFLLSISPHVHPLSCEPTTVQRLFNASRFLHAVVPQSIMLF